jgi:hypothetical protein
MPTVDLLWFQSAVITIFLGSLAEFHRATGFVTLVLAALWGFLNCHQIFLDGSFSDAI